MNENLYCCLKQLESSAQAALFAMPQEDSPAYEALNIENKDAWKFGALMAHLIWLHETARKSATSVYMTGKE